MEHTTRHIAMQWFDALKRGDGQAALACLDEDVHWVNNPGVKGLSDIIPWLGDFHGLNAVIKSFEIWGQLSSVVSFDLVKLVIDGDEVFAVVHEVATIKATGLNYDIEFIQRFRVAHDKIVEWKSYWDTVQGIVPFRGDMQRRLIRAAKDNQLHEAQLVLPFGCDPNTVDPDTGETVLMIAAGRGYSDIVRSLIDAGADVNGVDRRAGATPLHKAAQGGHLEIVRILTEAGAFINAQCASTGHTPLVEAIWFKCPDIVGFLLARGAGLAIDTHYGFSLRQHLDYALQVNVRGRELIEQADRAVAARRQSDAERIHKQRLMAAVKSAGMDQVKSLLAQGVSVDERYPIVNGFDDDHTPLLVACRDGHSDIARELLRAGANVNAVEPTFGAVPLHKAVYNGHADIAQILVQQPGININFQGYTNGYTPLLDSIWHGYQDCAMVLLDAGARSDLVGHDGLTPLALARDVFGPDHQVTRRLTETGRVAGTPLVQPKPPRTLYYVQMKWVFRDKNIDDLFRLEVEEAQHAEQTRDSGMVVGIWKVASQHRVIAIVSVGSAEELDANSMFRLPMRNFLEFEAVWPLCEYGNFTRQLIEHVQSLAKPQSR
jgi:ankyrin repeat protein/ketosteroid isomerase-like protein/muconolactone delta-isomerase